MPMTAMAHEITQVITNSFHGVSRNRQGGFGYDLDAKTSILEILQNRLFSDV